LWLTLGAAAGFAAARLLMERELPEQLPPPVREGAERARSMLLRGQQHVREAIEAGRAESARKERELTAEYLRQSKRLRQ
jgi:hypothetical protein